MGSQPGADRPPFRWRKGRRPFGRSGRVALAISALLVVVASAAAAAAVIGDQGLPAFGEGNSAYIKQEVTRGPDGAITGVQPPLYTDVPSHPALRFKAGVSYQEAVTALFTSRVNGITVPEGATLVDPLPAGKVVNIDGDVVELDPAAPIGYDLDSGRITDASFSMPGNLTEAQLGERINEARREGLVVPRDGWVTAGPLPRCEISYGRSADPPDGCQKPGADTRRVMP